MEVIPAIDLIGGGAVRLKQGRYDQVTHYAEPPAQIAREFARAARRLHVVDLEGAKEGRPVQTETVRAIVSAFGDGVQLGGGIRTLAAVDAAFALGVARVVLGTAAIADPELVRRAAEAYPGRVIVAVDAKDGMVATNGWVSVSGRRAIDVVREVGALPIAAVLYTDIQKDGMETGPNVAETARLSDETGVPVIASGGVGTLEHIRALARASKGIVSAIVGKALHEKRFSLEEAVAAAGAP